MGIFSFIIVTVLGGAAMYCSPLLVPVANILGFGSAGVRAGTIAAWAQSYIGNVAPKSLFSYLQSVAMSLFAR